MVAQSLSGDTALYLRLSRDDGTAQESESIASQRAMLLQYAAHMGLDVYDIFTDDGYSGTLWERPAFQQMLLLAKVGQIRTIITKDLSRLSRDYIHTGQLLEQWFPAHGIRFIAINDGIDTANVQPANEFFPLRAVLNDWYARDISHKVRSALQARQQKGICTLATVPFGYQRKGESIVPNEKLIPVIQWIFAQAMQGQSLRQIARSLTAQRIPTPRMLQNGTTDGRPWNDVTVRRILQNSIYIGRLQLHCTERISHKCKQKRYLPAAQWHTLTVPPIITEQTFAAAAAVMAKHKRHTAAAHWCKGLVICGECGSSMTLRDTSSAQPRLQCSGRRNGNGCCNSGLQIKALESLLHEQFIADGIPYKLPHCRNLITEVRVYRTYIEVSVIYRKDVV